MYVSGKWRLEGVHVDVGIERGRREVCRTKGERRNTSRVVCPPLGAFLCEKGKGEEEKLVDRWERTSVVCPSKRTILPTD